MGRVQALGNRGRLGWAGGTDLLSGKGDRAEPCSQASVW